MHPCGLRPRRDAVIPLAPAFRRLGVRWIRSR